MNILFILPEYYPHSGGGISTYYLHYINALKQHCKKIKVIVIRSSVKDNNDHIVDNVEVEYLRVDLYNKYLNKFSKFDLLPEFKKQIAAAWAMFDQANAGAGFDIIECTDYGLGFMPWVNKHNKPVITRLHGSAGQIHLHETNIPDSLFTDLIRQTELLLLPVCDRLITHSKANKKFWTQTLNNENVIKIDPVFNTSIEHPLSLDKREQYGLVTARVQEWKGPVQLCEALSKVKTDETPQIKWIGRDMPYDNRQTTDGYLKMKFPSVWGKHILPHKPMGNEQIQALQQKVKFGIVPSTWDMFNFTCLEFLAAGTPVICSDGAGCSGLIEHGKNGFKYPALDTSALAECILQVNRMDKDEYNKIAVAGLDTVYRQLSATHLMPFNLEQYSAVINNFKQSPSNPFLNAIYDPSDTEYQINDILDQLPLKRLMSYVLRRAKGKMSTSSK